MGIFERFTKRAKLILEIAKREAIKYGHNKVEPEHILLAMIEEGQGMGIEILRYLGIDPERVKFEIEKYIKIGVSLAMVGDIPLSNETKRVIGLFAVNEAQILGHTYIGSEHFLLGLLRDTESLPGKILERFGANIQLVRKCLQELTGAPEQSSRGRNKTHPTKKKSTTPALDTFGRDLTRLALEGELDPVIGRTKEIERIIQILCRRKKNNPVLLGDAGVGKTAIVEGFAQKIARGDVPDILRDKRIVMLDLASIVAGTKYRGEFEQRIKIVLDEIKFSSNIIIFIDEIHTLVGAGNAEGAIDASNILKPSLATGEIQCIGATTFDEYRKYIEKDAALERRFQPILVNPPSVEETIEILKGLKPKYESHHKLKISDDAIEAAAKLSDRYITGRNLPDKAIDLIDEALSQQRVKLSAPPKEIEEVEKELAKIIQLKEENISKQDFEKAASFRDRERELKNKLNHLKENWEKLIPENKRLITKNHIAEVVSQITKIPVVQICKEEKEKLLEMEKYIHKIVVGQDDAISAISKAIRRSRAGLKDAKRPIGSFLFLGPTGVGKTLLAHALAEFLFGDEQSIIQIDMSEYMEKFSISRLIGAPPGYVGYEEGGQLTERVRRRPYSIVLLDEIEKAHPDVFNLLLQILEEGKLTDSFGRSVSFKNTILIMTSNIGTYIFKDKSVIGFQTEKDSFSFDACKEKMLEEVKRIFKLEFLNRLDEIIVFQPLKEDELLKIVDLEIAKVMERLKEQNFSIIVEKDAKIFLKEKGISSQFGARHLRRVVSRYLEDPLSEEILKESFPPNSTIIVSRKGDFLAFDILKKGEKIEEEKSISALTPS